MDMKIHTPVYYCESSAVTNTHNELLKPKCLYMYNAIQKVWACKRFLFSKDTLIKSGINPNYESWAILALFEYFFIFFNFAT